MEISLVDLVFQTLSSWGSREMVVNRAAINPRIVMAFMVGSFSVWMVFTFLCFLIAGFPIVILGFFGVQDK